ncbi:MAG: DUF4440 domain-containing protein [Woeseiaceae bacterium]|nr:DUF4440 domain-containing protein [Woeseiaceae bacterium]
MNSSSNFVFLTGIIFFFSTSTAFAQDSANDAADVILVIEAQWQAEQDGDGDWVDNSLADNFSGWAKQAPAPRGKRSVKMWNRFQGTQGRTVAHELYFQNIVIHGDIAIAHYLYTSAFQDKEKKTKVSNGRYTDVLIRTDDGWKFIAWHGGDDD